MSGADLPPPPLPRILPSFYVTFVFRSWVGPAKLRVTEDSRLRVDFGFIGALIVGIRSVTHAAPVLLVEPIRLYYPNRTWMVIESTDGYRVTVGTRATETRVRELAAMCNLEVKPDTCLREKATKWLERGRPGSTHL